MHYAWTIKAKGRQNIERVTTLADLQDTLRILSMPGLAPPDWIIMGAEGEEFADHGRYIHNEGGKDEWSLNWKRANYEPKHGD